MTKILNLDELATEVRSITMKGVEHPVLETSVESFIAGSKLTDSIDDETPIAVRLIVTVKSIMLSVPTLDESLLMKMPMEKLTMIAKFVRGDDDLDAPEAGAVEEGADGKK